MRDSSVITVIYTIRDREPKRLDNSISSLKKQSTVSFKINVVDYGSKPEFVEEIKSICKKHQAKYIRAETQGKPWSRSHGLNIGVKQAKTKFIVTTDIDMIFEGDILEKSLEKYDNNYVIRCIPLWLNRFGIKSLAKKGDLAQLGGYMFIKRDFFLKVGGFDERIKYWGREDAEFEMRLKSFGIKSFWLEKAKMYHVWHLKQNGFFIDRPLSSFVDSNNAFLENLICGNIEGKWGRNVTFEDRPIIKEIQLKQYEEIFINKYEEDIPKILQKSLKSKCLRLVFKDRLMNHKYRYKKRLKNIIVVLDYVLGKLGYKIEFKKNLDFDQFYISMPFLVKVGLVDFYIHDDFNKVDLFFK